jgi:hypothetical protein
MLSAGCGNVFRPFDGARADEGLFYGSQSASKNSRYQEASTLLETLVNTYPESEYAERAKLALDDIWYAQGGVGPRPKAVPGAGGGVTFFLPLKETLATPEATKSGPKSLQN